MPGDLAHYAPTVYYSLLVPAHQLVMHRRTQADVRPKVWTYKFLSVAEFELSNYREALAVLSHRYGDRRLVERLFSGAGIEPNDGDPPVSLAC